MKTFRLLSVITAMSILATLLAAFSVQAQENVQVDEYGIGVTQEIIDDALKPKLTISPIQKWPSKEITIILEIDSSIDSDRVSVDWSYVSSLFLLGGQTRDVLSVRQGEVTRFEKKFTPRTNLNVINSNIKRTEFGVRVNAFVADVNYLSSTTVTPEFTADLELLPQSAEFQRDKIISTVANYAVIIFCVVLVIAVIVMAVKRFRAYINTPDPET